MRSKYLLLSFLASLLFWGAGWLILETEIAVAQENKNDIKEISFVFEPGFTIVRQQQQTIFIDYQDEALYLLDNYTKKCTSYELGKRDSHPEIMAQRIKIFTDIKALETEPQHNVAGNLQVKTLLFGPLALLSLSVKEPQLGRYGLTFKPGRVDYLVAPDHQDRERILQIAEENSSYYNKYPLLRQVDILGLIQILGGVPIRVVTMTEETDINYHFAQNTELKKSLPGNCR